MVTYIITEKNQKATPFFRVVRTGYGGMYKNGVGFLYGSYRGILSYFYTKTQIGLVFLCKIMYDRDVLWDATAFQKIKEERTMRKVLALLLSLVMTLTLLVPATWAEEKPAAGYQLPASLKGKTVILHTAHQRRTWRY